MSEKYFLGAMTLKGFVTSIGEYVSSSGYYTYILKGGAGTGKSSLMKRIADKFEQSEDVTRYYCSSDPDSLDAVVLHSSKAVVMDGTAPHVFDPVYPGACQRIVDLGRFWNTGALKKNKNEIVEVTNKNKSLMASAAKYSAALGKICEDTLVCGQDCLDKQKLEGFSQRFCKKAFGKSHGCRGSSNIRQLSAMTRYGYMTFKETLENYLDVYYLCDDLFAASHSFIQEVAEFAVKRGYDVNISPCLLFEDQVNEHLLIDELGIAFVSSSPLTKLYVDGDRINMSRFYHKDKVCENKQRIKENLTLIRRLKEMTSSAMDSAKIVHDEIESFYITSMHFDQVDKTLDEISSQIAQK